ncbi:BTB/POZ domain-containing protein 17-like [Dreissena polymorpha]|uniref:BTB domain-containing protein n=1 Tax=Dreissena polymorpha TaxID=45954 RepID=A0A9D4L4R7_DREPO|nr:BTB/POZ domain-containing protein 17-like [Dreissena polymorpha]XP_052274845.1 BTB/POZ domain-containing protein 17-like [Dreissena polymorpha]XP_052274846.1 BTB/POZ domain-containing protein 17-like [Dreissena polymorpha]XP_052274847.1 BTB/POZ domain-containing protein 17-like [Dreissena polymorpha]XP_052274848.1 BTB/POZ domain-containing protein 17-like [Dreissena polymorpha]XP_052274849.1 BTB/POZ domain-containing protein 17-like [Dreissena polymorpha]KAH3850602.1 hypothetical protein D
MAARFVDNSCDTTRQLLQLYQSGDLSDLILKVGQRKFKTHRLILCVASDVFRTMLMSDMWPEGRSRKVVLCEDAECEAAFDCFLTYIYSGQVELRKDNVLPLLTLADKYNVPRLAASCIDYMKASCCPETVCNVFSWLHYAIMCGYREVEQRCTQFMACNFDRVIKTFEFSSIAPEVLKMFLEHPHLTVSSEYHLYLAVKRWLLHYFSLTGNTDAKMFHHFMSQINFPLMQFSEILKLEKEIVPEFESFYLKTVFSFLRYQKGAEKIAPKSAQETFKEREWCIPRIYPTETWSTDMVIDNVLQLREGEVRGAFFSTPLNYADSELGMHQDWHVMFYPRGVVYQSCQMIGIPRNIINPGGEFHTVRLALSTECQQRQKFKISVLIYSVYSDGPEYVYCVKSTDAIFDKDCSLFNFDGIIPYDEVLASHSPFRIGDSIKMKIVIRPLAVKTNVAS